VPSSEPPLSSGLATSSESPAPSSSISARSASGTSSQTSSGGPNIRVRFVSGYDASNALLEDVEEFGDSDEYFMKGYMLEFQAPEIEQGTEVTWTVTRGGTERGTYHPSGQWTDYFNSLSAKPTGRIAYWRSDYAATEAYPQTYAIECTYTDPNGQVQNLSRNIKCRILNPDDPDARDNVNTDTKMVQRAMVQVFGLDKGRLDQWEVGLYRKNWGTPKYYHSTTGGGGSGRQWSKIADEVWNYDRFVLGTFGSGTSYSLLPRQVAAIWVQFGLILQAGAIGEVRLADVNVANVIEDAELVPPAGFPKSAVEIVSALCKKEGGHANPAHSFAPHAPLAVNSIRVGEAKAGQGVDEHSYTDWGIGFGAVQPYNAAGKNLYHPGDNLLRTAEFFKGILNGATIPPQATGPKSKVWFTCYGYNQGPNAIPQNAPPSVLRANDTDGAKYADQVFDYMGVTPPVNWID
jgi:hypothetical protein